MWSSLAIYMNHTSLFVFQTETPLGLSLEVEGWLYIAELLLAMLIHDVHHVGLLV